MPATATNRIKFIPVDGAEELFTPEFVEYLVFLHDRFAPRVRELLTKRAAVLDKALKHGVLPAHPPVSEINTGDWKVPPVPEDLKRPGIEISGPASLTSMFINALNPGPEGTRAEGDLDDDEDSAGHRLVDTLAAAQNRLAAVERTLTFVNVERGREYKVQEGEIPFFMHRERGLHLPALMEDLATGRMSVAQIAQRIIHHARDTETGEAHDFGLVKRLLQQELEDILDRRKGEMDEQAYSEAEERYRKSIKIAMKWIKSYTDFDFRSLGSYTRADLDEIAAADDAF